MTILADELKVLRQRALLTQEEFAKTLSVAPSTVNRWEMSKAKPNVSTMKKSKPSVQIMTYPMQRSRQDG